MGKINDALAEIIARYLFVIFFIFCAIATGCNLTKSSMSSIVGISKLLSGHTFRRERVV